ncbi:hypothetical protein NE237_020521 [Protea cynaroides]|uniref:Protein kinase domain-containing protein n=1 Tax=Protea cynaroides TaxID=273540 RepID=A0A9Q0H8K1_9MAGN|nr:hypothetical protein NE237_020521 [Protea cynaroides]
MALVRQRRNLNLRLPLPDSTDCLPCFPVPLPPTLLSSSTTTIGGPAPTTISSQEVDRLSNLKKLKVLGHGNSRIVYQVRYKRTSAIYALKVIDGDCDTTALSSAVQTPPSSSDAMEFSKKPSENISILMEYMDGGTLDTLLKSHGTLSELSLSTIARQVLEGLNYLNSQKIVHMDIKPANLLVNQKMEVKIADFGVNKIMCRSLEPCDSYVGTCAYMSPERFDPDTYGSNYNGYAADIWSLGLTVLELYVGHFPLLSVGQRPDWATLMCAICFGGPPSLPESASEKDSSKRWRVSQLLSHPFIAKNQGFEN